MSFRPERSAPFPQRPLVDLPRFDPDATMPPAANEPLPVSDQAKTLFRPGAEARRETAPAPKTPETARSYAEKRQALARAIDRLSAVDKEADAVLEAIRDGKDDALLYRAAMDEMPVGTRDAWNQEVLMAEKSFAEAEEAGERLRAIGSALERAKVTLGKSQGGLADEKSFAQEFATAAERAETAASVGRGWTEVGRRLVGDASRAMGGLESRLRSQYAETIGRVGPEAFMRQPSSKALAGMRAQAVEDFLKQHPGRAPAKVPRQTPAARAPEPLPSVMIAPEAMPQAARDYFQAHSELEAMKPSRPLPVEQFRPQDQLPSVMIKPEAVPQGPSPEAKREQMFAAAKKRLGEVRDAVVDAKDSADLLEYAASDAGSPEALAVYAPLRAAHGHLLERLDFSARVLAAAEAGTLSLDDAPLEAQLASFVRGLDEIRQEQLALDREMHAHEGLVRRAYAEKVRKDGEAKFLEESWAALKQPLAGLRAQAVEDYRKTWAGRAGQGLASAANRVRGWFRRS